MAVLTSAIDAGKTLIEKAGYSFAFEKESEVMHINDENIALVTLLRSGLSQHAMMQLRQRLIEGVMPSEMLPDHPAIRRECEATAQLVDGWIRSGERPLTWLDPDYPNQLREVYDFPPIVFVRGQLAQLDYGVCVVGSRIAGQNELQAGREIAHLLVEKQWTVVSGLAKGIDTAAHTGALSCGGRTVAVIGNGTDHYYPHENRQLQQKIEKHGMVISQFWPGTSPTKHSFPMRNAVMSAYARATIIVTATEGSGTRHQAKQAAAHGRPLVVSRFVYSNASWARQLVDNPGVLARVARSADEAVSHAIEMAELTFANPEQLRERFEAFSAH